MRILFAIAHYFAPSGAGAHGSEGGSADRRAQIVRDCVASLQQNFAESQALLDGRGGLRMHAANADLSATITIALCTTGDNHLVPELEGCRFNHIRTNAEPVYLGFECHKVLRSGLGRYDWFVYLEDDLRLADGLAFHKLAWFNGEFGDNAVLQPNRFEIVDAPAPYKLYIDGNLADPSITRALQRIDEKRHVEATALGHRIAFQRIDNPHSGCFFLNAAQFARWAEQPDFAVPSARLFGPLESAASLGIAQYFRVYKPARENAAFFEIEHLDRRFLGRIFESVPGEPSALRRR
ncbi:MAG: calcium-binding protein [Alphaproteobacteria bacterium]|nr:calcium-binding protein [Alphaproteobacteria bacterium]